MLNARIAICSKKQKQHNSPLLYTSLMNEYRIRYKMHLISLCCLELFRIHLVVLLSYFLQLVYVSPCKHLNVKAGSVEDAHGKHDHQEHGVEPKVAVQEIGGDCGEDVVKELQQHEHVYLVFWTEHKGRALNDTSTTVRVIQEPRV